MIRVFIFLALLLVAAAGFAWLADQPGKVALTLQDKVHEVDLIPALLGVIALALVLSIGWTAIRLVFRLPGLMTLANRNRRKARGYQALSRGMVAVSEGDARQALRQAGEAQRLLGAEPLSMLLSAQSAQLAGDATKAEKAFGAMLEHGDTRVVGMRGLHMEAARKGEIVAARFYAEEAYRLAPASDWASQALLTYRCADRDWLGAMALVEQAASRRLIDKDTARQQRAVLLTADALDKTGTEPDAAVRAVQEAVRLDPSLSPAAAILGRKTSEKGEYGKASKLLEAAWSQMPHPDVAEAYLDVRLGDSGKDRLKRARTLQRLQPAHPESRLTMARAAIDAKEFRVARENLETLVLEAPTVRACILMAELEEHESGNLGLVREWLARASRAGRDKAWVADGKVSENWLPVSPTGKVGGYVWMTPPEAPAGALLLEEMARRPLAMAAPTASIASTPVAEVIEVTPVETAAVAGPATPPTSDNPGIIADARPKSGWKLFSRQPS